RGGERAFGDFHFADLFVLVREQYDVEHLALLFREAVGEVPIDVFGRFERAAGLPLLARQAPAELQPRFYRRALGRTDALDRGDLRGLGVVEAFQILEFLEESARAIDRALSRVAGAQQNRDKLGVGQAIRAALDELFARPVLFRPLRDRLVLLGH